MEAVDLVVAAAAIEARPAGALVHVFLTVVAAETGSAHTLITIHQVLNERETKTTLIFIFKSTGHRRSLKSLKVTLSLGIGSC